MMVWFKKATICTRCNKSRAKREFEGTPTCAECKADILMGREATRMCPVDGTMLLKEHNNEILIDRCPQCNGVWLDAGEIEAIKEAAQAEGMAVGMVVF